MLLFCHRVSWTLGLSSQEMFIMKMLKKILVGAVTAVALTAAQASPITVGGITWDPDYQDAGDKDFGAQFKFTQWYSNTSSTGGTIPVNSYTNALSFSIINTDLTNGGSFGNYWLQGAGEVDVMNGQLGTFTASGLELTYAFGGIKLQSNSTFDATNGWFNIYVNSTSPNFTYPASNESEVADAQSGLLWLSGNISDIYIESGNVSNALISANLNITGGAAQWHFDPKTIVYSADAIFDNGAKYSRNGNGDIQGNTVPEPATLALMGIGLLGFAGSCRRAKNAVKKHNLH